MHVHAACVILECAVLQPANSNQHIVLGCLHAWQQALRETRNSVPPDSRVWYLLSATGLPPDSWWLWELA